MALAKRRRADVADFDRDEDQTVNNVCYFRLALQRPDGTIAPAYLNLLKIYLLYRDVWPLSYDPAQFGSANIRLSIRSLGLKNVAALVFSTGKVVCPGPSSAESGLIMAHAITREISRVLGAPFCMRDYQIPNVVGKIHANPIDLKEMASVLGNSMARYKPERFPACFVFPYKNAIVPSKVVYLFFTSGKGVITGCDSESDLLANQRNAHELASHFPLDNPAPADEVPATLHAADRALLGLPEPAVIGVYLALL
jgi:TATA-box binding protein (TBP) (component of TFIID and TFIIIB)